SETANGTVSSSDAATSVGAHFIAPSDEDAPKNSKSSKPKKGKKNAVLTRAGFEKNIAEHIAQMPDTTILVLLLDETLEASNPLVKAAEKYGKVFQNTVPKGAALEHWITERAKSIGVQITPEAVALLANFIGGHRRLVAHE